MQISRELELPYNTAWFLLHRIRNAMSYRDGKYMLSGIVELDGSYFGKTKKVASEAEGLIKSRFWLVYLNQILENQNS